MLLDLIIFVAIVGLIVWAFSLLPLPAPFQQIILVVGVIACVLALLQFAFGVNLGGHFSTRWH
jgi:hypothetical protein